MDVARSFTYFGKDDEWAKNLTIGSMLTLTIIGFPIVLGWYVEVVRRTIRNNKKIPGWSNIGQYTVDGLKLLLLMSLVYLPAQILGFVMILTFGAFTPNPETFENQAVVFGLLFFCLMPIMLLVQLFIYAIHSVFLGILADTDSFLKALNPVTVFKLLKANYLEIAFTSYLIGISRNLITSFGTYLCLVGIGPAVIYGYSVSGNLLGQIYLRSKEKMQLAEQTAA